MLVLYNISKGMSIKNKKTVGEKSPTVLIYAMFNNQSTV
jgi:hypothetical protein